MDYQLRILALKNFGNAIIRMIRGLLTFVILTKYMSNVLLVE